MTGLSRPHPKPYPHGESVSVPAPGSPALFESAGEEFLSRLAEHFRQLQGVDEVWICACVERGGSRRLLCLVRAGATNGAAEPLLFDPAGTPCQAVLAEGYAEIPAGVVRRWPASALTGYGFEGFLGQVLGSPGEEAVGLIALLSRTPAALPLGIGPELGACARRAAAEVRQCVAHRAALDGQRFLQRILHALPVPVFYKDAGLRYRDCNAAFEAMLGMRRDEIVGKTVFDIVPGAYAELNHQSDLLALEQGQLVYENGIRFADGSCREVIYNKAALYLDEGGAAGVVGTIQDISAQRRAEREVHRLANFDAITGLPNRGALLLCLETFCRDAAAAGRWLMTLDIDRFHALHASCGHDNSNLLLQLLGQRLLGLVGEEGLVARIGGDRFGICWFEPCDEAGARTRLEQVRTLLGEPFPLAGRSLHASACIGLARVCPGDDAEGVLRCAETALRQAKQHGRGSSQFFARDHSGTTLNRFALEADLRQALDRQEMSLVFQPQIDLHGGGLSGLEALLRWQHPLRGAVPPDLFIPLAEETGQIHAIGRWVLEEACAQARRWQEDGLPPVRVAVNVSGRQLQQGGFCDLVSATLQTSGLDPAWLELELTESTVMEQTEANIRVLDALKELGVHLSIDDFGTGYSSLAYLKRFPIDKLKIDRAFIADLPSADGDKAIAEAIIALAHGLGLKVVAEGVETAAQAEFLRQRNCTTMQGYYSGRPMTPSAVTAFLADLG